jgi:hypothetical protein
MIDDLPLMTVVAASGRTVGDCRAAVEMTWTEAISSSA